MSAKKKAKPKNTIDMEKLAEEVRTKIRKKVDKEKPANKEVSTSKELPQRACIDCHFLVTISLFDCKLPTDIGVSDFNHYIYSNMLTISRDLVFDNRELIHFRGGFSNTSLLGCWNKCWVEYDRCKTRQTQRKLESQHTAYLFKYQRPYDRQKVQELRKEVVEIDRSYCYLFYPYTEGMSFDAAKEMQGSVRLLRAGQIRAQSDQTKPLPVQQSSGNGFVKKTDYWLISYEGETIQLTVSGNLGLEYIAHLLGNRGREYESHKLRNIVENKTPIDSRDTVKYGKKDEWYKDNKETADERPKKGFKATMDGVDVVLDKDALKEYKDALKEYNEDLDEAKKNNDLGQIDKIEEVIGFIKSQMVADAGLKDRPRKFKSVNETARKAISNNVNRVYKKLEKEHQPLWNHLKKNITISHNCSYSPEKNIDWNIKL